MEADMDTLSRFTAVGFNPMMRLTRKLGLPKALGRFIAVYFVFGLSAWMHAQGESDSVDFFSAVTDVVLDETQNSFRFSTLERRSFSQQSTLGSFSRHPDLISRPCSLVRANLSGTSRNFHIFPFSTHRDRSRDSLPVRQGQGQEATNRRPLRSHLDDVSRRWVRSVGSRSQLARPRTRSWSPSARNVDVASLCHPHRTSLSCTLIHDKSLNLS
jgi:hypothetical protein